MAQMNEPEQKDNQQLQGEGKEQGPQEEQPKENEEDIITGTAGFGIPTIVRNIKEVIDIPEEIQSKYVYPAEKATSADTIRNAWSKTRRTLALASLLLTHPHTRKEWALWDEDSRIQRWKTAGNTTGV